LPEGFCNERNTQNERPRRPRGSGSRPRGRRASPRTDTVAVTGTGVASVHPVHSPRPLGSGDEAGVDDSPYRTQADRVGRNRSWS
jgi:hypothetical protein